MYVYETKTIFPWKRNLLLLKLYPNPRYVSICKYVFKSSELTSLSCAFERYVEKFLFSVLQKMFSSMC